MHQYVSIQTKEHTYLTSLLTRLSVLHYDLLPPATKLGQGNNFRSVCEEFCSQRGGCLGPDPGSMLWGLDGGGLQAHTWGEVGRVYGGCLGPDPGRC